MKFFLLCVLLGFGVSETQSQDSVILVSSPNDTMPDVANKKEADTNNVLEEVVMVGYGTQKKKDLTGAVSKVNMGELATAPVRSFDEALTGRVAGVRINSDDGQPGAEVTIAIRGNGSATQNNSPLYVIDGFPVENQNLNAINPKDIESIDILKDASATAIYGSRAANGVIILTTKRGKIGPPVIQFGTFFGVQEITSRVKLMNAGEFVAYQLEKDFVSGQNNYLKDGRTMAYYTDTTSTIDWQNNLYRTAYMQNYNLSISGGSAKSKYGISGSALMQEGIVINSNYERYQGKVSIDETLNSILKIGGSLNYSYLEQGGISPAQQVTSATTSAGFAPFYSVFGYSPVNVNSNINLEDELSDTLVNTAADYRINPIRNFKSIYSKNITNNTMANTYIEVKPLAGLTIRSTAGINYSSLRQERFNDSNTLYGNTRYKRTINGSVGYKTTNNLVNENTINWNKKINKKHQIGVLGGITEQITITGQSFFSANQIANGSLGISSLSQGIPTASSFSTSSSTLMSFLSRVTYAYNSRYLLTLSYRADGSSKFSANNRWGYFPSGSIAWNFGEEKLMQQNYLLKKWLSKGKIRISYGATGNNRVVDYAYLNPITTSLSTGYSFNNSLSTGTVLGTLGSENSGGAFVGTNPTTLGNKNLKWETTYQFNMGLDLAFLNNKIDINIDLYDKTTQDLLLAASLPTSSGYTTGITNAGAIKNQGLEIALTTKNINANDFLWETNFNISFNKNQLLSLNNNQNALTRSVNFDNTWSSIPAYISSVGESLGQMFGYLSDGVYQYADFDKAASGKYILKDNVPTNGNERTAIQPGDIKYKDINGDGVVNTSDYTIIGSGVPMHTGGINNQFSYKGIELNVFLQWSYGNDILNANRIIFEGNALGRNNLNQFASYTDRWTDANQSSKNFRTNGFWGGAYSSRYVEDGSFIRLKTISLAYHLQEKWTKKMNIKKMKVYISTQNIYTLTNYSGFDPEVNSFSSALTPGFDYSTYPRAKTIVIGLDITL